MTLTVEQEVKDKFHIKSKISKFSNMFIFFRTHERGDITSKDF